MTTPPPTTAGSSAGTPADGDLPPATLKALSDAWEAAQQPMPPEATQVSPYSFVLFFGGYTAIGGLALCGGVIAGMRSFEGTVAYEALDKLEKPTPKAEAQAMRMATRALGWGTALAFGSAGLALVGLRQAFGIRSAREFGEAVRATLQPADNWLRSSADSADSLARAIEPRVTGFYRGIDERVAGAARAWRRWWPAHDAAESSTADAGRGA
tara:strand:- start:476 stop:1111 length:636 start_codon:yes stop_codon:yes gene_type:complete